MARASLVLLLVSIFYTVAIARSASSSKQLSASNFIKASCKTTTYPLLCVQSLSGYATSIQQNPHQLVQTALSVSIARAQSTKTFVSKLAKFKGIKKKEYAAIKDCVDQIGDSVDRLSKSLQEMNNMGRSGKNREFLWHMSNVQTWVSAALTDENTCVDGFSGKDLNGKMKDSIKANVVNVAQVTSNALALVNKFASKP